MTDLISRQAAINTAFTMRCRCDTNDIDDYANMILAALEVLPTIEPKKGAKNKMPDWIGISALFVLIFILGYVWGRIDR